MTLSSEQFTGRGLDAMLIVYSLLDDHPASDTCESFIRDHVKWFTTTLTLLEAQAILTKVYDVDVNLSSQQLSQFSAGPIEIITELKPLYPRISVIQTKKLGLWRKSYEPTVKGINYILT